MPSDLLGTLYKAMTGLNAFTRGLDNLSNNVANLNTTGYKANDVFYRELEGNQQFGATGDDGSPIANGQGVAVGGTTVRFVDGELSVTGRDTDMAIDGNGFFIVRDGDREFYTRAGQFEIDRDGYLSDPGTGYRVAKIDASGNISDINLRDRLVSAAVASTEVQLRGTLNSSAVTGTVYPPQDATATEKVEIKAFDKNGRANTFFATFTKQAGGEWKVDFKDASGNLVGSSITLEFGVNGAPIAQDLSQLISLNFFDLVEVDKVKDRFSGVPKVSIEATPGELDKLGEITVTLTEGELVSKAASAGSAVSFLGNSTFTIDSNGFLIDKATQKKVAARDPSNPATLIDASIVLQNPAQASTALRLSGVLDAASPVGDLYPPYTTDANGNAVQQNPITVQLYDAAGNTHDVSVTFVRVVSETNRVEYDVVFNRGQAGEFKADKKLVYIRDGVPGNTGVPGAGGLPGTGNTGALVDALQWRLENGDISATWTGTDAAGAALTINFDLDVSGKDGAEALLLKAGADSAVTATQLSGRAVGKVSALEIDASGKLIVSYSNGQSAEGPTLAVVDRRIEELKINFAAVNTAQFTTSGIQVEEVDGRATGQLTSFAFNEDGTLVLKYSNEDEVKDGRVAMALFTNTSALQRAGDALFTLDDTNERVLGSGTDGAFGKLVHKSIERSNVELSREFAEIIIVQRGFQAASQVLNATNELIQELYSSTRGGR
jgi:flagellar hook-basal body protein